MVVTRYGNGGAPRHHRGRSSLTHPRHRRQHRDLFAAQRAAAEVAAGARSAADRDAARQRIPAPLNLRISYAMFESLSQDGAGLDGVAIYAEQPFNIAAAGEPVRHVRGMLVSGSYFNLLGVQATRGRLLTPADDDSATPARVAVVSEGFWRARSALNPVCRETIDHPPPALHDRRRHRSPVPRPHDWPGVRRGIAGHQQRAALPRRAVARGAFFWLTAIGRVPAGQSIAEAEARLPPAQARAIREGAWRRWFQPVLKSQWRMCRRRRQ